MLTSDSLYTDTIVAPATPSGRGGVAIIRISGSLVKKIAEKILGKLPPPRQASFFIFRNSKHEPLDEGLAIFFPAPNSFTGEDVLELQGHASPVVIDRIINEILKLGARFAKPGEFSERAFLNDKMDLAQAEAIADLIDASTEQAARASLRSLQGEFSKQVHSLVEELIYLRMFVEAAIDFVEEEIDFLGNKEVSEKLLGLIERVELLKRSAMQGSLLREGITVVIAGEPNVGKSSLLNCLSGKDTAIVTDIPGTTRDVLREYINIDGMPIHFIDTAGLRVSDDPVEQEGIRRAHQELTRADMVLCVVDAREPEKNDMVGQQQLSLQCPVIIVRNKVDLLHVEPSLIESNNQFIVSLSAKKGSGISLLKEKIKSLVGFSPNQEGVFSARRRHLDALDRAYQFLLNGRYQLKNNRAGELLAEDLRQAQLALNEITGEFSSDDLLGKIFASFCVGK